MCSIVQCSESFAKAEKSLPQFLKGFAKAEKSLLQFLKSFATTEKSLLQWNAIKGAPSGLSSSVEPHSSNKKHLLEEDLPLQFASLFWLYHLDTYAILEKSGFFTLQTGNLFYVNFDFTIALFKVQPTDS